MKRLRLLTALVALGVCMLVPTLAHASSYSLQDYPKDVYITGSDKASATSVIFDGSIETSVNAVAGYLSDESRQVPERLQQMQELYKVSLKGGYLYTLHYAGIPTDNPTLPSFLGNEILYVFDEDGKIVSPQELTGTVDDTGVNLWMPVKEDTVYYLGCSSVNTVDVTTHKLNLQGAGQFNFTIRQQTGGYVKFDTQIEGVDVEPHLLTTAPSYVSEPEAPTYKTKTFKGWYKEPACLSVWDFTSDEITGPRTLYAKWNDNPSYDVTFDTQLDGVSVESTTVATIPALVPEPEKPEAPEGLEYAFAGWFKDAACTLPWDFSADVLTAGSTTLYGKWTPATYSITYEVNGGTVNPLSAVGYSYNDEIDLLTPTRSGYVFAGWFTTNNFSGVTVSQITRTDKGDKTFYAKWTPRVNRVTFNTLGGTSVAAQNVVTGGLVSFSRPTRSGYAYKGWYTDAACTKPWYFATNKVEGDMTLYTKWASTNSYLSTVKKTSGTWDKKYKFRKTGGTSRINISKKTSKVTLTPARSSSKAKVYTRINNGKYYHLSKLTLRVKSGQVTKVTYKVVSESGAKRYYTVKIRRR